ncbi:putative membrane protein [Pseudoalteromonas translucida]|uniref:Membrane protein n=1 Tax=Pseudoalteromonas translucida (strain TAC 125) TaxID=326442 RepID=Q3IFT2_PSET1|nr:putative membrane protein [Pseudoalteromonas translucida]
MQCVNFKLYGEKLLTPFLSAPFLLIIFNVELKPLPFSAHFYNAVAN